MPVNCTAVIGQVSNIDHENVNLGKAGRKRHMGVRPGSRGTMTPVPTVYHSLRGSGSQDSSGSKI